jgi:broad specificity phosphatase PhoE
MAAKSLSLSSQTLAKSSIRLYFIRHAESHANTNVHVIGGRSSASPLTTLGETQALRLGQRLFLEGIKFDAIFASTAQRALQTAQIATREMIMGNNLKKSPAKKPKKLLYADGGTQEILSSSSHSHFQVQPFSLPAYLASVEAPVPTESSYQSSIGTSTSAAESNSHMPESQNSLLHSLSSTIWTSSELEEQSQGEWEGQPREQLYTAAVHRAMLDLHVDFHAPAGESLRDVRNRAINFLTKILEPLHSKSMREHKTLSVAIFTHGMLIRTMIQHLMDSDEKMAWRIGCNNVSLTEFVLDRHGTTCVRVNDSAHLSLAWTRAYRLLLREKGKDAESHLQDTLEENSPENLSQL